MQIDVLPATSDSEPDKNLLVRFVFDSEPAPDFRRQQAMHTGLRPLAGAAAEDWISSVEVVRGTEDALHYAHNNELCFVWLYVGADEPIEAATHAAYANAFRLLKSLGFSHLLRAWHYLPGIHAQEAGVSRYGRFCRGRFEAFAEEGEKNYCAATVIGTHASFGAMCFLAAREVGVAVENPRQTSAWRYPFPAVEERPLFTRAVCKTWGAGERAHFYGSGTAGIVGHISQHPGDAAAQLREALVNLRALLDEAPGFGGVEHLSCLKAYVARAGDTDTVREALAASAFTADSLVLLEGEICRTELSVEIEALIV